MHGKEEKKSLCRTAMELRVKKIKRFIVLKKYREGCYVSWFIKSY
jgi:hypothetical protein